ncbi:MAG TPA: hypothetical protein VGK00_13235 [Anaerolineales bacterium]|jgi:KDO2-lipid IV(A) lauroyltransferase
MASDLQKLVTSSFGINLAQVIGRILPPKLGYPFAKFLGEQIARRHNLKMVQSVRANQWVVHGGNSGNEILDPLVREAFRQSARSIYDLYHFNNIPGAIERLMVLDATTRQLIQRPEFEGPGLIIAGLHLSGFDLCLQWLVRLGMKPLVLTIPDPQGGRQMELKLRKKSGMKIIPGSMTAIRQALKHLQQGGIVLTGIDRPIQNPISRPRFFGQLAALPTHHIFLALKARVPVMVMVPNLQQDGKYHVLTSHLIEMETYPNREIETIQNAEKVLYTAEGFIRMAPEKWTETLPVWPDILNKLPSH